MPVIHYQNSATRTSIPASRVIVVSKSGPSDYSLIYAEEGDSPDNVGTIHCLTASGVPSLYAKKCEARDVGPARENNSQKIHVIVSIASGTRQAEEFYNTRLKPIMNATGWEKSENYEVHFTTSDTTVTELARDILAPPAAQGVKQQVILLSGDGGVVDIVNALMSSQHINSYQYQPPTLAIIPLGTGNALANSLKVTADNSLGLRTLYQGVSQHLPIFKATFSPGARILANEAKDELPLHGNSVWGCVVCSWGLHSSLVADSDTSEYRKHGAERFQMAAKENLFPADRSLPHEYSGKVSVLGKDGNWQPLERAKHAYILATLVSNLEKTFTISPASKPLDGKLRLVHFGPSDGNEAMEIMVAAYNNGKHVEDPRVGYEEIEGLRINFEEEDGRWRRVCVDGKIVRVEKGGWVEVTKEKREVLDVMCQESSISDRTQRLAEN
ncbi:ATP-NAD kinase-like domain-containing protein [Delphinella strobiligena]|nr:ATP-NAD kinase-like domain-containing protein [Delphinella strobiligena]